MSIQPNEQGESPYIESLKPPFSVPIEITPLERRERLVQLLERMKGNDKHTQAMRVLRALEGGPCTTVEIRKFLDVMQVSTRIYELRTQGYNIQTYWVKQFTDAGEIHRIALYVLPASGD